MKESWLIITLLLAIALVILSIKVARDSNAKGNAESSVSTEEAVIENIMTRNSVRSYTSQPVETAKIETLLKAGMAAPTAGNRQPWEMIVINEREILDAIPPIIRGAHMAAKSQLAIAVCGSPSQSLVPEYWVQDCSAVTENILLAAHAMGLGAVWCGAYPNNEEDKVGALKELFNLPEDLYVLSIIVIGYPDGETPVKDKWKPEKVRYNRY